MPLTEATGAVGPDPTAVLTKAVLRAAEQLGMSALVLGTMIGLSGPSISRMKRGEFQLSQGSKPFELGVLFIRLFRSLDAITGGDATVARAWLRSPNNALSASPLEKMQTIAGLMDVIGYLDARRAVL